MWNFPRFFVLCCMLLASPGFAADNRVKVGAIFSLSGWGAEGGAAEYDALRLAVEDINQSGGILGKPVVLITEDNRSELRDSTTAFKKLVTVDRVSAVIGPNWAEFAEVIAPLSHSMKAVAISPSGYKPDLFKPQGYFFSMFPPPESATRSIVDYILRLKISSLTILVSENAYLLGLLEALKKQLQQESDAKAATRLEVLRFNPGHQDYRSTIAKLKKERVGAVMLLLLLNSDLAPYLRQAQDLAFAPLTFTSNDIVYDEVVTKDRSLAEGVIFFEYFAPGSATFTQRFRKFAHREPNFGSAKAYDALMILKRAIEECGLDSEQIARCIRKDQYDGESGLVQFDRLGRIRWKESNTYLLQVQQGVFKPLSHAPTKE